MAAAAAAAAVRLAGIDVELARPYEVTEEVLPTAGFLHAINSFPRTAAGGGGGGTTCPPTLYHHPTLASYSVVCDIGNSGAVLAAATALSTRRREAMRTYVASQVARDNDAEADGDGDGTVEVEVAALASSDAARPPSGTAGSAIGAREADAGGEDTNSSEDDDNDDGDDDGLEDDDEEEEEAEEEGGDDDDVIAAAAKDDDVDAGAGMHEVDRGDAAPDADTAAAADAAALVAEQATLLQAQLDFQRAFINWRNGDDDGGLAVVDAIARECVAERTRERRAGTKRRREGAAAPPEPLAPAPTTGETPAAAAGGSDANTWYWAGYTAGWNAAMSHVAAGGSTAAAAAAASPPAASASPPA